jgi:hypothetical protein
VLPTIQTYGGVGPTAVGEQIAEVRRRGLPGCQAYTIAHATDAEWAVLVRDAEASSQGSARGEDEMAAIDDLRALQTVAGLFLQAASHALRGERLPGDLKAQIKWLLG